MGTKVDISQVKAKLLQRQHALQAEIDDSTEARSTVILDQQSVGRLSRMDALQQQAMANAQMQRRQHELRKISAALVRIEEGEYGYCVSCGDDIASKRLANDPAVPICLSCMKS